MSLPTPYLECQRCGELNGPANTHCGVCGAALDRSRRAAPPIAPAESGGTLVAFLLAFFVVLAGVFLIAPGLGFLLAVVSVPPLVRTLIVIQRRAEKGQPSSLAATVALFVGSLGVTTLMVAVVTAAAVGTFCFVCIAGASTGGRGSAEAWVPISIAAAACVVAALCYGFGTWIRARWRRDVGE